MVRSKILTGVSSVPAHPIDWSTMPRIETWWANHPYNQSNTSTYVHHVGSINNAIVINNGDDLQDAIDALDNTIGGTFLLKPGSYGDIELVGKSNVHFIAEQRGTVTLTGVEMFPGEDGRDYTPWMEALRLNTAWALTLANNRPSNVLFRNIYFNGGDRRTTITDHTAHNSAAFIRGYHDVLFEDCVFTNYLPPSPFEWSPGCVNGNALIDNIFFRRCTFDARTNTCIYLDGVHGGGAVYCRMGNVDSMRVQNNTNRDFTFDLNQDSVYSEDEMKNTNYVVYAHNQIIYATGGVVPGSIFDINGGHILLANNVIRGVNYALRFLKLTAACIWNRVESDFHNIDAVIRDNETGQLNYAIYVVGETSAEFIGIGEQHVGTVGQYTITGNVIDDDIWIDYALISPTAALPNTVGSNTFI